LCNCSQHGECMWDELMEGFNSSDTFQIVACDCEPLYEGQYIVGLVHYCYAGINNFRTYLSLCVTVTGCVRGNFFRPILHCSMTGFKHEHQLVAPPVQGHIFFKRASSWSF